jgi:hypothetical protein
VWQLVLIVGAVKDSFFFVEDRLLGLLLLVDASLLQLLEFFGIGFVLIAQGGVLEGEVFELLFIEDLDFGVTKAVAALRIGFVEEEIRQFETSDSEDAGFERSDTVDAPLRVGEKLNETVLFVRGRGVLIEDAVDEGLVDDDVVGREENGLAG